MSAVTWKDAAPDAPFRVRVSLKPGQMFQLDGAQRQSISLLCGADASTLAVVAPAELITHGATAKRLATARPVPRSGRDSGND